MMNGKGGKLTLLLVIVLACLLFTGTTASAQAPTGEGPFDAMAPTEEWMALEPGTYHWYKIKFDMAEDEVNEPLEIRMFAEPYASATLTVRNQDQVDQWVRDGEQMHFGCCTMVDRDLNLDGKPDYAEWAGTLTASGDYYIVVEHAKNVAETANYRFTVNGKNISYPTAVEEVGVEPMAATPQADEPAATMAPVLLAEMAGSGPDFALPPTGAWTELKPGEYHWYVFDFDYDVDSTEPVTIKLFNEPYQSATLTVRNADQAQLWRDEGEQVHFGCCTLVDVDKNNDGYRDYGEWAGSLRESGRYYIVLEHARDMAEPAYYRFTISGENLSFPLLGDEMVMAALESAMPEETIVAAESVAEEPVAASAPAMAPSDMMGTGPDFAMAPTDEWMELDAGQYHWYKFDYNDDEDWTEPVTIKLFSQPDDLAVLTVRNGDQAELWRQDGEHDHFGCCVRPEFTTRETNVDDIDEDQLEEGTYQNAYASWSGDLGASGTYYIVVEHAKNSTEPAFYRFEMSGDGL